jgi:hypothetical protein
MYFKFYNAAHASADATNYPMKCVYILIAGLGVVHFSDSNIEIH